MSNEYVGVQEPPSYETVFTTDTVWVPSLDLSTVETVRIRGAIWKITYGSGMLQTMLSVAG